jgi:hypothetical protein
VGLLHLDEPARDGPVDSHADAVSRWAAAWPPCLSRGRPEASA